MNNKSNCQECLICGISIEDNQALFSFGKPGSRQKLYARVCQYVAKEKQSGCINQNVDTDLISDSDYYLNTSDQNLFSPQSN